MATQTTLEGSNLVSSTGIAAVIESKIRQGLDVAELELLNESHMHQRGVDSHFKLVLVSNEFEGLSLVKRHQRVYGLLQQEMQQIHALAMHVFTPQEWAARAENAAASPKCRGGNGL
jgi:BolA protein